MIGLDYTYEITCGFCGTPGHNITTCPQVAVIAEDAHQKEACGYPITYRHRQALQEMKRRKQRKANKNKPRTKAKCSYCRNENHRRPSCKKHKELRSKVYLANDNWKAKFVETINEVGIGIGSLVMIPKQVIDWAARSDEWVTCMVIDYNLDSMNVFNTYSGRDNFRTSAKMRLATVDATRDFLWDFSRVTPFSSMELTNVGYAKGYEPTKIVSGCQWEPPEHWLTGKNPEIEYVLKKISLSDQLLTQRVQKLINKWS